MPLTRRVFCLGAALVPFSTPLLTAFSEDKKETKPPELFKFDKKAYRVEILSEKLVQENIEEVNRHLEETCANHEKLETMQFLRDTINKQNTAILSRHRLILGPMDQRETKPVLKKLSISPDVLWDSAELVKFGYPLSLDSNINMDIDTDHIALRKYVDPKDNKEKEGIYIEYLMPNPDDPNSERVLKATMVPIHIPCLIFKEKEVFFIDVQRAFKPKENILPRAFTRRTLIFPNKEA